jgi:hypothetical protein
VPGPAAADDVEPVVNERRDRVITGIVTAVPILSLFAYRSLAAATDRSLILAERLLRVLEARGP